MRKISNEQNGEDILMFQFLQRKSYDRAELLNWISWMPAILSIFGLMITYIYPSSSYSIRISLAVVSWITMPISWGYKKTIDIGAAAKSYIDYQLYGFSMCDNHSRIGIAELKNLAVKKKKHKEYSVQISNTGRDNPSGVRDWYNVVESESVEEIIFSCQKENLWWNKELSAKYMNGVKVTIAVLIFAIIVFGIWRKFSFIDFLVFMIFSCAVIAKGINEYREYRQYASSNDRAACLVELFNKKEVTKKDLLELQKEIDSIRVSGFLVPKVFHIKESKKMHELYDEERLLDR